MSGPLRVPVKELNYYVHFPWREGAALCPLTACLEIIAQIQALVLSTEDTNKADTGRAFGSMG